MNYKCTKCGGYLDTGYHCHQCGKWCPPRTETSAGTCTAGNGWCQLHGDQCPVTITTFQRHNAPITPHGVDGMVGEDE